MQYSNVPKFINPSYLTVYSFHLKWANVERVARASEAWCLDYVARRAELWRQGWVDPGWVFREIRAVNINKQHTDTWCGDTTLRRVTPSHTQGLQGNFCDFIHWSELKNLGSTGCGWYKCNVWLKKIWSDKHEEYFDANIVRSEHLYFKTFRLCRYYHDIMIMWVSLWQVSRVRDNQGDAPEERERLNLKRSDASSGVYNVLDWGLRICTTSAKLNFLEIFN